MTNPKLWSLAVRYLAIGIAALWFPACGPTESGDGASGGSSAGTGVGGSAGAGFGGSAGSATGGSAAGTGGLVGSGGAGGTAGAATGGVSAGTGGGEPGSGVGGASGQAGSGGAGTGGAGTGGVGTAGASAGVGGTAGTGGLGGLGGQGGTGGGAAGAAGAQCPATATAMPGNATKMIMAGGMNRSYVLHVGTNYTGRTPVPVVFDFHGLGGSGMSQMNLNSWRTLADSQGFITVYPNGVGNSWNIGRCCNPAMQQNVDDVGFVRAMINQLKTDACIDPKRIYATGCSNGGGMSYKLACDAADVIAAVAPVDLDCITGSNVNASCAMCSPSRPITAIQFRGTNDTIVPYDGGATPVVPGLMFPGAQSNFMAWAGINMCTGSTQPLPQRPACLGYQMCGAQAETVLCTVQNGSHCGAYNSFGIVNISWEMFQKHPLP